MPRLPELLRELREERNLSKARLARMARMSDPYLVQIESGERRPSLRILRKLAGALGVDPFVLYDAAGYITEEMREAIEREVSGKGTVTSEMIKKARDQVVMIYLELEAGSWPLTFDDDYGDVAKQPQSYGPEGWDDLTSKDQKLVQQLINRLRAASM